MNNILQLVWLIPVLPLLGFLINGLGRKQLTKSLSGIIGSGVILISFVLSVVVFLQIGSNHNETVHLFDFIKLNAFKITFDFKIDQLSALFLLIITGVGFLIHVY
jgi:NADH-quinone oxidoreductase subunit L